MAAKLTKEELEETEKILKKHGRKKAAILLKVTPNAIGRRMESLEFF